MVKNANINEKGERNERGIIIIKFGGDVLTDKEKSFSIKNRVLKNLIKQVKRFKDENKKKILIVHGGGSFGHPLAEKYKINSGIEVKGPEWQNGLIRTHKAMLDLNSLIIEEFNEQNVLVMPLSPLSQFYLNKKELIFTGINHINTLFEFDIIPILYGDVLLHIPSNYSILSGDRIISYLCQSPLQNSIEKVIFLIQEDGLIQNYQNSKENQELIPEVPFDSVKSDEFSVSSSKIDVTGGMKGKLEYISLITANGIPAILLNGIKPNRLYFELTDQNPKKTVFIPK